MLRRTGTDVKGEVLVSESGKTIIVIAIVYGLVLIAGFLYVGWQHSLELIRCGFLCAPEFYLCCNRRCAERLLTAIS
jgi:hypothetical protein